jgi:hypothetical protein
MSLKTFHVAFVSLCIVLCVGLAAWWIGQWQTGRQRAGCGLAWDGWWPAVGLVEYGRRALRKMRSISYL